MDLFRELNRAGSTIILITHDTGLASQASRMVHIDDGRLTTAPAARRAHVQDVAVPATDRPLQEGISP